jgi:hypothetical protein
VLGLETEVPPLVRAHACYVAGLAGAQHSDDAAVALLMEARALARAEGDHWVEGHSLVTLGFLAPVQGDIPGGIALMQQAHQVFADAGDEWGVGMSSTGLCALLVLVGKLDDAERYAQQHLAIARRMGDRHSIAQASDGLAIVALVRQDLDQLAVILKESIALSLEVGQVVLVAYGLKGLAVVAAREQPMRAARQFGAAEALLEALGGISWPPRRTLYDHALETVRAGLDAETFAAAWAEGRAMTLDQAVEYALGRGRAALLAP